MIVEYKIKDEAAKQRGHRKANDKLTNCIVQRIAKDEDNEQQQRWGRRAGLTTEVAGAVSRMKWKRKPRTGPPTERTNATMGTRLLTEWADSIPRTRPLDIPLNCPAHSS